MTTGNYWPKFKQVGLLLIFFLMLLNSPVVAQEPQPPVPQTQPAFDPRFGIVDSFVNTAEANAAGAGWTRIFFRWDVVQPGGPSDWKPANVPDTFIEAEGAAGRDIAAVLIGTPVWASESGLSTAAPPLEYWGDFVFKIASQYKGRIKYWIIWNQPDTNDPSSPSHTWDGTEQDYYLLLKEAYLKIKAVDPAMQVHLAGLTYTWDQERGQSQYLARLLEVITADPEAAANNYYFDAASFHLYYNPVQMYQVMTDVRAILNDYGLEQKQIWINETNAPPTEDFIEPPTGPFGPKISLEEQSAFVIQAFALSLAGGADRIAFNKLRNEQSQPASIVPYGLLRADNSRRPAFDAFRTAATYFAGTQQATWQQLGDIQVVTLERGEQTTTVLWNTAATPASYSLNAIAPEAGLVDEHGSRRTITAAEGVYTLELPGAICSNGPDCFIGGAPRLIVENGSPAQRAPLQPPNATLAEPTPTPLPTNTPLPTEPPPPPLPPTLTPTPAPAQPVAAITPTLAAAPVMTVAMTNTLADPNASSPPPPADILPDSAPDPFAVEVEPVADDISATPTLIPPVTITTVLRPSRLLWLFVIGLLVFTITYGIQVAIWYRLKR